MKINELQKKTVKELKEHARDLQRQVQEKAFALHGGDKQTHIKRALKKEIAQTLTILGAKRNVE